MLFRSRHTSETALRLESFPEAVFEFSSTLGESAQDEQPAEYCLKLPNFCGKIFLYYSFPFRNSKSLGLKLLYASPAP